MPKDYKNVAERKPPASPRTGTALPFLTGLATGLLVAVIVYIHEHNPAEVMTSPVAATIPVTAKTEDKPADGEELETKSLPEPTFEFYTILPSKEVNISEWETRDDEHAGAPPQEPSMYILQVGSFSRYDAADEIKARLAMLGITADIQRVVINGQDIRHRVRIGPYKNIDKLQEARDRLLANNLDFVLLKLKMDDVSDPALPPAGSAN